MDFLDPKIEQYATDHSAPESPVLAALNRETYAKVLVPRMLSGHLQGRVLSMLAQIKQPKRILEIGTYTGYSAICLAEGLAPGGLLHTIDINEELEEMVNRYIKASGNEGRIVQHIGNALDIVPTLNETWDLVFIDADKENYLNYYKMVIDQVAPGGLILTDNVLWSGKVLHADMDPETASIDAFNKFVHNDNRVTPLLLPVRDGLFVARKNG
jgi:caffeoyl-CoA O-methyltransferase